MCQIILLWDVLSCPGRETGGVRASTIKFDGPLPNPSSQRKPNSSKHGMQHIQPACNILLYLPALTPGTRQSRIPTHTDTTHTPLVRRPSGYSLLLPASPTEITYTHPLTERHSSQNGKSNHGTIYHLVEHREESTPCCTRARVDAPQLVLFMVCDSVPVTGELHAMCSLYVRKPRSYSLISTLCQRYFLQWCIRNTLTTT